MSEQHRQSKKYLKKIYKQINEVQNRGKVKTRRLESILVKNEKVNEKVSHIKNNTEQMCFK